MKSMTYSHYSRWPVSDWRWPSFSPREMASKREGELMLDYDAMDKLQALRDRLGVPMIVTSAYRSKAHNKAVGGASRSKHMEGIAFDIRMENHDPHEFEAAARAVGFTAFGYYPHKGFMHIDTRPGGAQWGTPWPKTESGLPSEPKPESRAPAAAAGGAGLTALALDVAPAASGILGQLSDIAQIVAIVAVVGLVGYMLWRGRE